MTVSACVLTLGLSPYLEDLVEHLLSERIQTRLYVNGPVREGLLRIAEGWPHEGLLELAHRPEQTIYAEWNDAAAWARERGDCCLLLLNDDIAVPTGLLTELHLALDARPGYGLVTVARSAQLMRPVDVLPKSHQAGTRRELMTWCSVVRPEAWPEVDPAYRIWYGDDDLVWKLNEAGWLTGVLEGTGAVHHTSTTLSQTAWVNDAIAEDGQRWAATH